MEKPPERFLAGGGVGAMLRGASLRGSLRGADDAGSADATTTAGVVGPEPGPDALAPSRSAVACGSAAGSRRPQSGSTRRVDRDAGVAAAAVGVPARSITSRDGL